MLTNVQPEFGIATQSSEAIGLPFRMRSVAVPRNYVSDERAR